MIVRLNARKIKGISGTHCLVFLKNMKWNNANTPPIIKVNKKRYLNKENGSANANTEKTRMSPYPIYLLQKKYIKWSKLLTSKKEMKCISTITQIQNVKINSICKGIEKVTIS